MNPPKIIILTHLILFCTMGCTAEQFVQPGQAQTMAAAAWKTEQHITWEVNWPAAPAGGPLTVETWRSSRRHRFEILEAVAPALIGETLVFDGQKAWQYNRFNADQPVAYDTPRLSPISDAFAAIDQLLVTPPQTATQAFAQTVHGPALKISLIFANGDHLLLWRNEETQLPVRVIFSVGAKETRLEARSCEVLVDPPDGLFKLDDGG